LNCWKDCGEAWVWNGYLQILLTAPRGSVDPIEQHKSKVECFSHEVSNETSKMKTKTRYVSCVKRFSAGIGN